MMMICSFAGRMWPAGRSLETPGLDHRFETQWQSFVVRSTYMARCSDALYTDCCHSYFCSSHFMLQTHTGTHIHKGIRSYLLSPEFAFSGVTRRNMFWGLNPCSSVDISRTFGGKYRLYLQARRVGQVFYFWAKYQAEFCTRNLFCFQPLATLWASMACNRDIFTFTFTLRGS
jgi:hypothetical protein